MATFSSGFENGFAETDLDNEDEAPSFFYGLKQRDKDKRAQSLEQINKTVEIWVSRKDEETARKLLEAHMPTMLRLSVECPLEDVRTAFTKLVAMLKVSFQTRGANSHPHRSVLRRRPVSRYRMSSTPHLHPLLESV